ncbi:MAG: hypothetical protein WBO95_07820 [Candidatus Dechloromonas phosphoritropha]
MALVYDQRKSPWDNRWSLFVRLANPEARRKATTSRPWLMFSVGRKTEPAGQTTITLTGLHAHFGKTREVLRRVSAQIQAWATCAVEQLNCTTPWSLVGDHFKKTFACIGPSISPIPHKSCKLHWLTAVFRFNSASGMRSLERHNPRGKDG